jgi:hypothetical protein
MRLFTIRGVEVYSYESLRNVVLLDQLFYSFGDDFDYQIRYQQLKFKKELGKGGFGVVNLMYD